MTTLIEECPSSIYFLLIESLSTADGFHLMQAEPQILVAILLRLIDHGITVLPVHAGMNGRGVRGGAGGGADRWNGNEVMLWLG